MIVLEKGRFKLRPLMFVGTGSDVGKSILATGLCRILKQDGYTPAPFKAQNMSLNSYATPEGLEIGRAQAVQAEAAGLLCETDMNPLLLKPTGEKYSQVVLNGKVIGNRSAYEYFRKAGREELVSEVHNAFDRLKSKYHPIVMEGAGSISELNLKETDLVNMSMALYADAAVILVADIDRGGVFASVYGSIALLPPEERAKIKGIVINKFRGDLTLFEEGRRILEDLCKIPVVGIVPYYQNIYIEEEDSVALAQKNFNALKGEINVVVILLKQISNFTDFGMLERDPRVHLFYSNNPIEIEKADIIIIPGSKNTLSALYEIRKNGVAQSIIKAHKRGSTIIGICGGYQILGQMIYDPHRVEGELQQLPGLGLLPVETVLEEVKKTVQTTFNFLDIPDCSGYEIHMGRTTAIKDTDIKPLNRLNDGSKEGCILNEKCFGTYMHGVLDNPSVIEYILAPYSDKKNNVSEMTYQEFKEVQYDLLADHLRKHIDIEYLYDIMKQ